VGGGRGRLAGSGRDRGGRECKINLVITVRAVPSRRVKYTQNEECPKGRVTRPLGAKIRETVLLLAANGLVTLGDDRLTLSK